jgi:oligosaccharide repeat unit polymerase
MLETLLIVTLAGFILSCLGKPGIGNPFKIYFLIWFIVILGYYLSRESYIRVSNEFFILLLSAKIFSFVIMSVVYLKPNVLQKFSKLPEINNDQDWAIFIGQIVVVSVLPFIYLKASAIAGSSDVFSMSGYIKLRLATTSGNDQFGIFKYFGILSFVISSLTIISYQNGKARSWRLVLTIFVSLFYIYLGTGRTYLLLLVCLAVIPSVLVGAIRMKGIVITAFLIGGFFIFVSGMAAKGISSNLDLSKNFQYFYEHIKDYTTGPLVAFSGLTTSDNSPEWGQNSFRFLMSLQHALGISDASPVLLIREYTSIPDPINVYTVYETYFRDFSFFGIFIPPFFLIIHYWLYKKAIRYGNVWIFYYSASVYPLVMQFFQDQYLSLLSTWIQIAVWYWLFLKPPILQNSSYVPQNA